MKRIATAGAAAVVFFMGASSLAYAAWGKGMPGTAKASAASLSKPSGTATAQSSSVIRVGWTAPSGVQGAASYVVRRIGSGTPVCTITDPKATLFCDDSSLSPSTAYNYTLEATLGSWSSGQSTQFGATTQAAALTVTTLTLNNGTGGTTSGVIDAKKDSITIGFSAPVRPQSICSSFSNTVTTSQTVNTDNALIVTVKDNAAAPVTTNDQLTVTATSAACGGTVNFGTLDLGSPNWTTATRPYSGNGAGNATALTLNGTHDTLTISIGSGTSTPTSGTVGNVQATLTPSANIKDDATNTVGASGTKSTTNAVQF